MSYCRWSTDNFKCDIYAYESDAGFVIHIASYKIVGEPPAVDIKLLMKENSTKEDQQEYIRQSKINSAWMNKCERVPIGLPYDGESYTLDTAQEFYDKMIELREVGYRFPDYVLEVIKEEAHQ